MTESELEKLVDEVLKKKKKEEEAKLRKKVRTKIFFIGIVCATLILVIVANSLAWFNNTKIGTVEELSIKVTDSPTLEIQGIPMDGNWSTGLKVNFFPLQPVCGNGDTFYSGLIESVEVSSSSFYSCYKKMVVGAKEFEENETIASHALVKEFVLNSKTNSTNPIFISPSSALTPDVENSVGSAMNSDGLNTALVAGAVRVAFYTYDIENDKYNLCAIWIPNPNIELVNSDGLWVSPSSSIENGSVTASGNAENTYYFVNSSGYFDTVSSTAVAYSDTGYTEIDNVLYFWDVQKVYEAGIGIFPALEYDTNTRFKLVIWIDGTDRECENALQGGKMGLNLIFTDKNSNYGG